MEPLIILLVVGAVGGIVRSFLGYKWQADEGESFNYIKMVQSITRAAIGGTVLVLSVNSFFNAPITTVTYVYAFMTAIGTDVVLKEGYGTVKA